MIGQSISHYRVIAKLGAGGMGEVYRATDSRLNRDVALKVLPTEFANDAQRMARFEREAQLLAALNHPNIAAIYGLEHMGAASGASTATRALVMELVEGPTLAARIATGPLPLDEALPLATQIAEALEFAHERGIIHRDLKPANVKLTPDGTVKILDFGLAKALADEMPAADMSTSPTLSMAATKAGLILGTAAYMSPEQARGKPVDRRADIWSFGVVLFEMLTGRQVFGGETVSDSMAAVITREPNWNALPAGVPSRVRNLLRRCLTKDPRQRLQAIGEARVALENPGVAEIETAAAPRSAATPGWRRMLPWALAGALTIALAFAMVKWRAASQPVAAPRMQFAIAVPADWSMSLVNYPPLAISPDSSRLAFIASRDTTRQIFVRNIDSVEALPLAGTDGAQDLTFSPDGQWLAFYADLKLKKIPVAGGPPHVLAEASSDPRGLAWADDDSIIFSSGATVGLERIPATGGAPQSLTKLNAAAGERTHRWPHAVAGSGFVIFTVGTLTSSEFYDDANIDAVSLATGQRHVVLQGASMARYAPSGYLIYGREGILYAAPFDAQSAKVSGQGIPIIQNVGGDSSSGAVGFSVSANGSIAYVPGGAELLRVSLAFADRSGKMELLKGSPRKVWDASISPDGRHVVMAITEGRTSDIWTLDVASGSLNRMTFAGTNRSPIWTRDGKQLIFASTQGGPHFQLHIMPADGSRPPQLLVPSPVQVLPNSVSPDGRLLAVNYLKEGDDSDIYILNLEERKFTPFFSDKGDQFQAQFSPDGRWLAYTSAETGSFQVYVQPYPATGGRWQISVNGGRNPRWSANGAELFYDAGVIMAAKVDAKAGFKASTPVPLFGGFHSFPGAEWNIDLARDGRFLISKRDDKKELITKIHLLLNWAQQIAPQTQKK